MKGDNESLSTDAFCGARVSSVCKFIWYYSMRTPTLLKVLLGRNAINELSLPSSALLTLWVGGREGGREKKENCCLSKGKDKSHN
jgi:hypothetical protein